MSEEENLFTCKECGSHILRGEFEGSTVTTYTDKLECTCGEGENGVAATREHYVTRSYRAWGLLDDDHHYEEEDHEDLDTEDEDGDVEIHCHKCYENASETDWENIDEEPEEDEESGEWYVRCDGCDREIEFGWSHPDRGGRIWPSECTDFNPWRSWPEPRYREKWGKKGWLRPEEP
jgi:hypothetical protein